MITINLNKAKIVSHEIRRTARENEFAPWDTLIMRQVPNQIENAEAKRQLIREKYAIVQTNIDQAENVETLSQIIKTLDL